MPNKRRALGFWLVLLVACAGIIARTQFRTDMGAFLPQSAPMAQQVLTEQATSGAASHLIVLALTGAPAPILAAMSETLAGQLRQRAEFIDVINGDDQSFAGVQGFVWANRYLLSADITADRFTATGLHAALLNDLGLLGSDLGGMIQQTLPGDPTGEALTLLRQLGQAQGPASIGNVWFSSDGARALLLVHTSAPGFDIDSQQQALTLINGDFGKARRAVPGAAGVRLIESGPGVFAIHIRDTTKRDVTRLSLLAMAGAVSLLSFAYRSPRVLLLGILPIASGVLAAIATVSLTFGFVHGVTLGFGVTLIGESIDYAIYLFTQTARGETASDTIARIWPTLRLGMLTSTVGFSAMLFSSFTGFAQLGLFSIAGLIVAAGVTRFVLPHLVPQGFCAAGADSISRPLRAAIRQRRRLRWLVAAGVLASIFALTMHRGALWDNNLENLSPIPARDQAQDQMLRRDLGVPDVRYFAVFKAADKEGALEKSEDLTASLNSLVARGKLGGFDVPSMILPSLRTQRARQAALPGAALLRERFTQAQAGLPFRADAFEPFFRDVAATKTGPLLSAGSLPPPLALQLGSMLVRRDNGWVVMAPLHDVADPAGVARAIALAGLPGVRFVDLNHESDQLLQTFQREAVLLAVTGSLAVVLLLLAGLRSVARVITVVAPLAAAVIMTAALLTLGGGKVSIFMVVGFLLIVAVGSNYCLFFERSAPDAETWHRSIASIVLANLCTVSAYGLMALSSIPVLHDIGMTVAMGTFLSLVCAALLKAPGLEA
ncbi:membrane protein [Acidocella aquatica]|uniref:Membrane protein n=1 Tax=Acidocella aquatica TaxID=1922313 RepID=A0ABQ6A7M0_9PROT|nr:MMPL family transporter [Acidocella aquatica]GLR66119.1 membrane protein [Acidocella aquatica]